MQLISIHYGELILKGKNRTSFEDRLVNNVRAKLEEFDIVGIRRLQGRMLVELAGSASWGNITDKLKNVFGFSVASPVYRSGVSMAELENTLISEALKINFESFAVQTKRPNKKFSLTSPEINIRLGSLIQEKTGARVDLTDPERTFYITILDNDVFLSFERFKGRGGLPVGVSGRICAMISGGIDSPVAAWLMMKRGLRVNYIHFHSMPFTNDASVEKVEDIIKELVKWQGSAALALVPFGNLQKKIVTTVPSRYRVILYRRFMVRIASRIAKKIHAEGLATGDVLGQVASQTLSNLGTIETVAELPLLRPLIAMDKQEIVNIAKDIGTFEKSIEPQQDCCSFLMPPNPAIRTTHEELLEIETELDVGGLVDAALKEVEWKKIRC